MRWAGRSLAPDVQAGAEDPDVAVLELAASVPPGSAGLVMLPYLLAERAPLWDPDVPGAYLGVRREHTRAHFVRAAIEGVCLQLRAILDRLDDIEPVIAVQATGGALRSPLWREILAAMFDRPLRVVGRGRGHGARRRGAGPRRDRPRRVSGRRRGRALGSGRGAAPGRADPGAGGDL